MRALTANECADVRIPYDSSVMNVTLSSKEPSAPEIKHSDRISQTIQGTLVLVYDGTSSAVVNAIRNDPSDTVTSLKRVQDAILYSTEAGLGCAQLS